MYDSLRKQKLYKQLRSKKAEQKQAENPHPQGWYPQTDYIGKFQTFKVQKFSMLLKTLQRIKKGEKLPN